MGAQQVGPQVYIPISQDVRLSFADRLMSMRLEHYFLIRTSTDPTSVIADVRTRIRDVEGDVPLQRVQSITEVVGREFRPWRSTMLLLNLTSGLSLLLAAVGIYAVLSYTTRRRTNEIGIRLALGADRKRIILFAIRRGLVLILTGALAGAAAANGFTRFLASQLFQVTPADPVALLGAAVVLVAVGLMACFVPARRACRVDPVAALQQN